MWWGGGGGGGAFINPYLPGLFDLFLNVFSLPVGFFYLTLNPTIGEIVGVFSNKLQKTVNKN